VIYMISIRATAHTLKEMLRPVNQLVSECRIHYTPDGIKSTVVGPANTAMIALDLPAHMFQDYQVNETKQIGLELWRYNQKLQYANKNDIIGMRIETEESKLSVQGTQDTQGATSEPKRPYKINKMVLEDPDGFQDIIQLVDPEAIRKEPKIPSLNNTAFITMPVSRFKKIIKKSVFSEPVRKGKKRNRSGNQIRFQVDSGTFVTVSGNSDNPCTSRTTNTTSECTVDGTGKAIYDLDELLLIANAIRCKSVSLQFANDYPLVIKFTVLEYGEIQYLLAPRVESA